jgi:hypothetical protein
VSPLQNVHRRPDCLHFGLSYKRLEAGRFQTPPTDSITAPEGLALTYEQLVMIIEGIDLHSVRRRKRYEIVQNTT